MKKTKLPKKLVLNKKTVTNLDFLQQKMIKGGCDCDCTCCGDTCPACPTPTITCRTNCATCVICPIEETKVGPMCLEPLTDAQSICCP